MLRLATVLALLCMSTQAFAGAWTQKEGGTQIIAGVTYSTAAVSFDNDGDASIPTDYSKLLLQALAEYGWNDHLTLFLEPEYAIAHSDPFKGPREDAQDGAVGGGVRYLLTDSIGMLSLQASAKTAGAFNLSVTANRASGNQAELRALYGTNFKILKQEGFLDIEVGERWVFGAQPNETPIDITLGLRTAPKWMLLAQSFNIISGSDAKPPYSYYRSHKLEVTSVYELSDKFSIQAGSFYSPAGQNALCETGFVLSLWARF